MDINDIFLYAKNLPKSPQNVPVPQPNNLINSLAQQFIPAPPQPLINPQYPPYNNMPIQPYSPPVNSSLRPGVNFQYKWFISNHTNL